MIAILTSRIYMRGMSYIVRPKHVKFCTSRPKLKRVEKGAIDGGPAHDSRVGKFGGNNMAHEKTGSLKIGGNVNIAL